MKVGARVLHNQRVFVKIATDGCSALQLRQQLFTFLKLQAADLSVLVSDLRVALVFLIQPQQSVQTQTSTLVFVVVNDATSQ